MLIDVEIVDEAIGGPIDEDSGDDDDDDDEIERLPKLSTVWDVTDVLIMYINLSDQRKVQGYNQNFCTFRENCHKGAAVAYQTK